MALTEERRQTRERDLPPVDDTPSIEAPGIVVARDDTRRDAGQDEGKAAPSLLARMRQHPFTVVAAVIVILLVAAAAVIWWLNARNYVSSDDAFIDTRTVTISPQVSGAIADVAVTDNQVVEAGTVLLRIDDSIYQAQLAQATANVHEAQANIANLDAQLDAEQARIAQANEQKADQTTTAAQAAQAQAEAAERQARAEVETERLSLEADRARLKGDTTAAAALVKQQQATQATAAQAKADVARLGAQSQASLTAAKETQARIDAIAAEARNRGYGETLPGSYAAPSTTAAAPPATTRPTTANATVWTAPSRCAIRCPTTRMPNASPTPQAVNVNPSGITPRRRNTGV